MFCIGWRKAKVKTSPGESVAVGFAVSRNDGLMAVHIGSAYTFLDQNERNCLAMLLTGEDHCEHDWFDIGLGIYSGIRRVSVVCTKCAKAKWEHMP